jgi:hypothetical protein
MKKTMISAFAALFTLVTLASASAQTPFFLNKKGAVAEYVIKTPDGNVMSYARTTVTGIDATDDRNYTVSYTAEVLDGSRSPMTAPMEMTTVVKDGAVEMAPNAMGMEITGELPSYPANLSVGQTFNYEYFIEMMGMKVSTSATEKVTAREKVTTPAGTFDCFKIETDQIVSAMGQKQELKSISWISAGIGNVKSETRDGAGALQMTQELVSLK